MEPDWKPDKTKFKNSVGLKYTGRLFLEQSYNYNDRSMVQYTLKDRDHEGYKSLYLLYLASKDITEYSFAVTYLDGWAHWQLLLACEWFKPIIERWRTELKLILQKDALKFIEEEAENKDSKNSFEAKKMLFNLYWKETEKSKQSKQTVGRPKKPIDTDPESIADLTSDYQRIAQSNGK